MKYLSNKLIIIGLIAVSIVTFFTVTNIAQANTQTSAPEIDITSQVLEHKSLAQDYYSNIADLPKDTIGIGWQWKMKSTQDLEIEYRLTKAGEWTDWIKADAEGILNPKNRTNYSQLFIYEGVEKIEYRIALENISTVDFIKYIPVIVPTTSAVKNSEPVLTASSGPTIIPRSSWMAGHSPAQPTSSPEWPPGYPDTRLVQTVIVHHQGSGSTRPTDPAASVYAIWYYHTYSLGWGDIGYNYVVDQYGNIYQGRNGDNSVIGGHAYNEALDLSFNVDLVNETSSVGVSVLGNYSTAGTVLTAASKDAVAEVAAWKASENYFDPEGYGYYVDNVYPRIIGHRDVDNTSCPGGNIYSELPEIRALAGAKVYPSVDRIHPNGTIMRVGGTKTVYMIQNGLRRAFTHWATYKSHNLPYILSVSADDIDNYEAGLKVGFRDGVLVRAKDNPTVYLIANDERHPFSSGTIFKALGYSFADVIVTDQDAVNLNAYGAKIDRSDIHPNGAVIKGSGLTVYLIDNGLRRAFTSRQVFNTWFNFSDVITVSDTELGLYTSGDKMTFNDGVLLQNIEAEILEGEENPVYIVSDQVYRPFADHMTFNRYSYFWENVLKVGNKEFALTTVGEPVTLEIPTI